MARRNFGFAHLLLLIILLIVGGVVVGLYLLTSKDSNLTSLNLNPLKQNVAVTLQTQYQNPFDRNSQYANPFAQYKNPFNVAK